MATNPLARWQRERPDQLLLLVISAFTLVVSIWLGWQASMARKRLASSAASWRRTADQLATVRQQFHLPSSSESADLLRESASLGVLGVVPTERVSLMELVTKEADASALQDVRVNFRPAIGDSVYLPPRNVGRSPISAAGYSLSVEFTGSFAGLLKFVSSLPPSVSVSRIGASRRANGAAYHVLLGVYEVTNAGGTT